MTKEFLEACMQYNFDNLPKWAQQAVDTFIDEYANKPLHELPVWLEDLNFLDEGELETGHFREMSPEEYYNIK